MYILKVNCRIITIFVTAIKLMRIKLAIPGFLSSNYAGQMKGITLSIKVCLRFCKVRICSSSVEAETKR